jgi:hypothetical protein
MKNLRNISLVFMLLFVATSMSFAQGTGNSSFDEIWNKASKTSGSAKDLNKQEQEKIKSVDIKDKPNFNPNGKGVDTTNMDKLSTQPIVKGSKSVEKPKEAVISLPSKTSNIIKADSIKVTSKPIVKEAVKVVEKEVKKEVKAEKPVVEKPVINKVTEPIKQVIKKEEEFSTQPIVKGKPVKTESATMPSITTTKKNKLDTTKNFKDFTFETSPVVGNNASYNRKNEPMPKTKEQIEDAIPVNRKPNNTNVSNASVNVKEAYAQYDKEADSLHSANKRKLDSIMKSLNIKVPIVINPNDFIDIYVKGGGVILNGDSKLSDNISILHTGVVQREYKTKNDGVQRTEKKISKDELTKLAQYIVDMGFFDFEKEYDCADADASCNTRMSKSPQLVPLQVSLIVGAQKNKVNVAIYAPKSEKNLVNYPSTLEKIMNAIYTIVEK